MSGTSERMVTTIPPNGKGKEIMGDKDSKPKVLGCQHCRKIDDNPSQPTCTCKEEHIDNNVMHTAFETLILCLQDRFQEEEPLVFKACANILHQFMVQEMHGREAFDRLTCILVNEDEILKVATKMFAPYMSVEECLARHRAIEPIDLFTLYKILDFYGI